MTIHTITTIILGLSQISTLTALIVYVRRHRPK